MAHDLYPPLKTPEVCLEDLKRGVKVKTRIFYADSLPGSEATVVRFWTVHNGIWVRCNYGKNLSGKSLLKTMPANVLTLSN